MIKIVIVTIVSLLLLQFILYYCNVDIFKMYIDRYKKESHENVSETEMKDLEESKEKLKVYLNELKQYHNNI